MNKVNLFATGILLACGVTCAKAQTWTDFTEKIVNPSFETGTTAETVAGELTGSMAGVGVSMMDISAFLSVLANAKNKSK